MADRKVSAASPLPMKSAKPTRFWIFNGLMLSGALLFFLIWGSVDYLQHAIRHKGPGVLDYGASEFGGPQGLQKVSEEQFKRFYYSRDGMGLALGLFLWFMIAKRARNKAAKSEEKINYLNARMRVSTTYQHALDRSRVITVPTREEINLCDSRGERTACEKFLGKTLEQAEPLFHKNSSDYQEALMWMGPVGFRYYIHAVIRYIQSEVATGDSDIIYDLADVLEFRLEHEWAELVPVAKDLVSIFSYIDTHQGRFVRELYTSCDSPTAYDDILDRLRTLQQTFLQMCQ